MDIIEDNLYGKFSISPLINELINSRPFERLKGIHQGGGIFLVNPKLTLTRHEHSIGVMLLIKLLGGTEIEQAAGLLHDISHTAFSHVIDYVFEHAGEDYHEEIYQRILNDSEIPEILSKYGYTLSELTDQDFNILEQPLPNLCADRVDYALRDLFYAGFINKEKVKDFISAISIHEGRIMVTSIAEAQWFKSKFEILNKDYFAKKEHLYANEKLTEIIKQLLAEKAITPADFEKDDTQLLKLIENTVAGKQRIEEIKKLQDFEEYTPSFNLKDRVVDPELYSGGKYFRLSEV